MFTLFTEGDYLTIMADGTSSSSIPTFKTREIRTPKGRKSCVNYWLRLTGTSQDDKLTVWVCTLHGNALLATNKRKSNI